MKNQAYLRRKIY